jgi:serine/threonine-protein kinase RsbW/stage II sporulation protein AB (anti-sigma F factor)
VPERVQGGVAASGLLIYERLLPALPGSVPCIRAELTRALERYSVAEDRSQDIALVFTEAATNAVVHAYREMRLGPLYVTATLEHDEVILSVCDCGRGMTPSAQRAGLGAGLVVMMRLADHLEISANAASRGTCVHATFERAVRSSTIARNDRPAPPDGHRGAMLREYLRVLTATQSDLAQDTQAVLAEAHHAVRHTRASRHERSRRR